MRLAIRTLLSGCNAGFAHVEPQGSVGFFILWPMAAPITRIQV